MFQLHLDRPGTRLSPPLNLQEDHWGSSSLPPTRRAGREALSEGRADGAGLRVLWAGSNGAGEGDRKASEEDKNALAQSCDAKSSAGGRNRTAGSGGALRLRALFSLPVSPCLAARAE